MMKSGFSLRPFFLITSLILSVYSFSFAQDDSNPFELKHRLPKEKINTNLQAEGQVAENPFDMESRQSSDTLEEQLQTTPPPTPLSENPFDIQRAKSKKATELVSKPVTAEIEKPTKKMEKPQNTRGGFIFWMILGTTIFLALLVTLYRSLIGKIYRAFTNENILKLLQREQSIFIAIPYLFLYTLFFISAGIFVFQVAYYYGTISYELINLAYCILGIVGFFLSKHFVLKFLEFIFPISKELKLYSFTIIIFSIILGIILIPFNVFIAFAQDSLTYSGIVIAFITIALIYLFRALRGLFIGSKFLSFHKFHFFMYLCAVEIAPLLILAKLLLNGANIH